MAKEVVNWTCDDVRNYLQQEEMSQSVKDFCSAQEIDGQCLLALVERDFYESPFHKLTFGERKKFYLLVKALQRDSRSWMIALGLCGVCSFNATSANIHFAGTNLSHLGYNGSVKSTTADCAENVNYHESETLSRLGSEDGRASRLKPEIWKTFLSLCYVFLVTWVTAVVMVIVHDKVPDMKKYPPLPDLFLDNVPHIPWAFDMCEVTGSILLAIWIVVLLFHKHRFILLRRFFALAGTVFLLRCITMLITSLSVPGSHLKCAPRSYPPAEGYAHWGRRLQQAYDIWSGAGMSVRGVRTCGDYMFSGHTVALTLLNFFITEYTSRSMYLLHIVTWVMNMFGIFFILAAHEHYSIDVFVAFYITSRLFLYYHTLSNNQALMQGDSMRTRIWFPLLSFFESEVDGIVPNEYEGPLTIVQNLKLWFLQLVKDVTHSSMAQMAGTKLSQGAAIGEMSMVRFVDGIKRNLNATEGYQLSPRRLQTLDKDVQANVYENEYFGELHKRHCINKHATDSIDDRSNTASDMVANYDRVDDKKSL